VLASETIPAGPRPHVSRLFDNNSGLDLRRHSLGVPGAPMRLAMGNVRRHPGSRPAQGAGPGQTATAGDPADPNPDTAVAPLKAGINSAAHAYSLGRSQMVTRLAGAGAPASEGDATFNQAEHRYATLLAQATAAPEAAAIRARQGLPRNTRPPRRPPPCIVTNGKRHLQAPLQRPIKPGDPKGEPRS
jgi:hypothetical protein